MRIALRARPWGRDLPFLVAVLVVIGTLWAFLELADEVMEGETRTADMAILYALREEGDPGDPVGPLWFEEAVRDITALGSGAVLVVVVMAASGFLILRGQYHGLALLLAASIGGSMLTSILKGLFERPRPEMAAHLLEGASYSFPSGHSLMAAAVYLAVGAMLARLVKPRGHKIYILLVAMALSGLVGASRVYLGVHYPTDVAAGWTVGLAWAVFCWLVASVLQARGKVEPER
jgi:undecaprenyl-diphosphatase